MCRPGSSFAKPPTNMARIIPPCSATVMINGKPAVRSGDKAMTRNHRFDLPAGTVVAVGNVFIG